ncbi:FAD-dependent oxidoreductase [Streptomyces pristinaespiralis]|uniref:Putative oxygenase n=1 Tax=Streptomyces pristinaespiralis TaxID=38300 RepID=D9UBK8_STRPR|nr:FAD-dependent oxidoreductase [Streptomyces pristinaespiralis]ALC18507.1 putative oxygenase [Streptomyces pristinaespiralis]ALC25458.1 putative oxygenase [Streptomyces pristinaespiralis]QMU12339.1 FAD-dependent monooxygenase [Streptomyces pristinaespiralis]CBW45655.1 putative oxygenase [Streptomyces pristinaespiralis]
MSDDRRPDVLVAGAGPVGLTAAHELARRGLRVRLVDAATGPARTSRAVAVHPRTLETLDQMGTAAPVIEAGRKNRAFTMFASGRRLVRLEADYRSMPTRHPYTVIIEQTRTEAVLRDAVARLGVEIEWGVRLTGLEQDTTTVRATLRHADGTEEICETPWLVGCDGGHSTVRKQLGLPLIGESRDTWLLADAPVRTDLEPDSIYWVHTGKQAMMMVPYARPGHWRLLDTAPRTPDAAGAAERIADRLTTGLGHQVHVGDPEWVSVFTFQQRMVPRMHQGRVFVAGDAAHVHSPASGQGMNTGIQEAYNLAWKLAMVHQGHAGPALLDTYSTERVPIGKQLLGSTRTATFLVQLKNALASLALPAVFTVVRAVPPLRRAIQRKVLGGMSGLRIDYATSPLTTGAGPEPVPVAAPVAAPVFVPRHRHVPAPGERAATATAREPASPGPRAFADELRDVRWTLLVAPGAHTAAGTPVRTATDAAARHGAWLSVRTVGDTTTPGPRPLPDPDGALRRALGLASGAWALIRPDGYLAAHGGLLTPRALDEALRPLSLTAPHQPHSTPESLLERASSGRRADRDTVDSTVGAPHKEAQR